MYNRTISKTNSNIEHLLYVNISWNKLSHSVYFVLAAYTCIRNPLSVIRAATLEQLGCQFRTSSHCSSKCDHNYLRTSNLMIN